MQFKRYLKIAKWTQKNLLRWKFYEIEKIFKILTKSILMARYFWYLKIAMWRTQRNLLRLKKILKQKIVFKTLTKSILMARLIDIWNIQCEHKEISYTEKFLKQKSFSKKTTWLIARQSYQLRLKNLLSRKVFKENNLIDCKTTISITAEKSLKQKSFSKKTTWLIARQTYQLRLKNLLSRKRFQRKQLDWLKIKKKW